MLLKCDLGDTTVTAARCRVAERRMRLRNLTGRAAHSLVESYRMNQKKCNSLSARSISATPSTRTATRSTRTAASLRHVIHNDMDMDMGYGYMGIRLYRIQTIHLKVKLIWDLLGCDLSGGT